MEAGERLAMEVRVGGEDDWEDEFALVFRGLSWHLFELDPDVDLRKWFVCDARERVFPDLYDDCERVMRDWLESGLHRSDSRLLKDNLTKNE
ncbi:hypothetical protein QJS10_CPA01g02614 [Acorus calamus]|uniref:Uncharacterized protein n=1 Tax=Acorus calamus TaxID=4465 RepID=A0AAV9FMC7_ACOCL|nr:hypothetical protein QJS10_CPA01g02614 [Acorus calamus]